MSEWFRRRARSRPTARCARQAKAYGHAGARTRSRRIGLVASNGSVPDAEAECRGREVVERLEEATRLRRQKDSPGRLNLRARLKLLCRPVVDSIEHRVEQRL